MRKSKQKTINSFHWQQKKRLQTPKTAAGGHPVAAEAVEEAENGRSRGGGKFFGCYLLTSLSPRYKGHTYIGFTVNPKRRIRQHNGEITSGASHTRMKRPWEMVFCIHGFPTNVAALQFEWAWQHPMESVNVRDAAATFKSRGGLANKIKIALTMLTLHSWKSMDLRVSFFSTKYMKHTVGCPTLPQQMKLHFCPMDELPCYWDADHPPDGYSDDDDLNDSRHNEEDFGELGEESHPFSINGFVEMNHSSSLGNAAIEEHAPPFRQVLPDVHGSILDEHSDPFRKDFSSDVESPSFPISEEHVSDVIKMNEELQLSNEVWTEVLRDSVHAQEEHIETIQRVDPFELESSSMVDAFESTTKEQGQQIDEQPLSSRVADTTLRPFSTEGIEVIDLFTPSPDIRIVEGSKKRRVNDSSDIIDLTRYKSSTQQNESQNG